MSNLDPNAPEKQEPIITPKNESGEEPENPSVEPNLDHPDMDDATAESNTTNVEQMENSIAINKLNIKGDFRIYYASSPKDKNLPFYKVNPEGLNPISSYAVQKYRAMLKEKQILFVSCPHKETLQLATSSLVEDEAFNDFSLFYAYGDFQEENGKKIDPFTLKSRFLPEQDKQILIVELGATENAQQFFDPILTDVFRLATLINSLKDQKSYFIYLIHHHDIWNSLKESQKRRGQDQSQNILSSVWEVDFLKNQLGQYFLGKSDPDFEEYEKEVQDQTEAKLWGDAYDCYQEVTDLLGRGRNTLIKQIKVKQDYLLIPLDKRPELDDYIQEQLKKESFIKVSGPHNPIAPYLLFVAVNFPEVGLREFQWLVHTVLGVNYDLRRKPTESLINQNLPEGGLYEIWDAFPEVWMRKVYLMVDFSNSRVSKIVFEELSLRRNATKYLENELFFFSLKCFEQIARSGIWYHPNASKHLVRGFTQLMVKKATEDPHAYGQQIPFRLMEAVRKNDPSMQISFPEQSQGYVIPIMDKTVDPNQGTNPILLGLLKEMLKVEALLPEVKTFFRSLLEGRQYLLVLKLSSRLGYHPEFQIAFWLRQLIERGDSAIKSNSYKTLLNIVSKGQRNIYEVLEEVKILWPKIDKQYSKYNIIDDYGLSFLFAYLNSLRITRVENLGVWPNTFPLFYDWDQLPESQIELQANLLGDGLFHPGRIETLKRRDDRRKGEKKTQTKIINDDDIAAFVEEWGIILLGTSAEKENAFAKKKFNLLLKGLIQDIPERRERLYQAIIRRNTFFKNSQMENSQSFTIQIHLKRIKDELPGNRRWQIFRSISMHLKPKQL